MAVAAGLIAALWGTAATAQGILIITDAEHAVRLPRPVPRPQPQPPVSYCVKELAVQGKLNDQIAQIQVSQTFQNTGSRVIEAQFVFPLPYDGAIDRLTLMVDGKEYPAKLLPKEEARRIYEGIVRRNQDPALLEWMGTGMFQTSVFPVPPGAERKVSLSYSQLLRKDHGLTDFLFPLSTAKYTSQPVESVSLRLAVESTADLTNVYSPTHGIEVERPDARHAVVKYTGKNEVPTSDFRLFYDTAKGPIGAKVVAYRPSDDDEGFFLLLASPQIKADDAARAAKNVVFVLDRSGSMEGTKIEQARAALTFVLNNLREGDRFNIVAYDSSVEVFRPEMLSYNEESRKAAAGFVQGLYAGGGTNIDGALSAAFKQFQGASGPSYLLFLTDGLPTVGERNESKLVAASKERTPGKVRMINFGVGYDVNSRLLDRLSREHHGVSEYVRPEEDIEVHVSRLYKKISAPVMTDVAVTFDFDEPRSVEAGSPVTRVYPQPVPDLFEGEQLVLVGRYRQFGRAKVTIAGNIAGQPQSFHFPAELARKSSDESLAFVEKLWAVRRIGEIIDDLDLHGKNDELVKELVALSTKHGILTPYTSFLADDTTRSLAEVDRFRRAGRELDRLGDADGRGGFEQRDFKNSFLQAENAARALPPASRPTAPAAGLGGGGVRLRGTPADAAGIAGRDEAGEAEHGLRIVGNQSLYRRGKTWLTPATEKYDIEKDRDKITVVERFSTAYFQLVAANTPAENQLLSSQQDGEELLVELRGKAYLFK
jgi:Ca-activated chloride channel family protein